MKKLVLVIALLLGLALGSIYIFIPSEIQISSVRYLKCIPKNASNSISDTANWNRWWPSSDSFPSRGYRYKVESIFSDGADISIKKGDHSYPSRIRAMAIGIDSTAVEWQVSYHTGLNPVHRLTQGTYALEIKKNTGIILEHLKNFAEKTVNIYGFDISRTTFTDTLLAAIKFSGKKYPSVSEVYNGIRQIKTVVSAQKIEITGLPMLNVNKKDSNLYETMLAIPIAKMPKPENKVFVTRMVPMKDRFLSTEVTGGPFAIQKAHQAIDMYMNEHYLSAPAIPFEILITDRSREIDTSKWRTIIFHPSM